MTPLTPYTRRQPLRLRQEDTCYAEQRVYLAWFVLHFVLIITISCRDIVWLVAHKLTILPSPFSAAAEKVEPIAAGALGDKLSASNPFRRALLTYLHIAGIDRGYGYFAPNVPAGYKLVFELHYPDGRVQYELPGVNSARGWITDRQSCSTKSDEPVTIRYESTWLKRSLLPFGVSIRGSKRFALCSVP